MIEPLLLTTSRMSTFFGAQPLTVASGSFFERDARLYLVTNRHVVIDKPSGHFPDRIEIEIHTDAENLTRASVMSVAHYRDGKGIWHQGRDSAGDIEVAAIEGLGYFLTDARTHRGTSGAPVVMRDSAGDARLPWKLLGVHSARLEMGGEDMGDMRVEGSLGLNWAWYADILLTLTDQAPDGTQQKPAREAP